MTAVTTPWPHLSLKWSLSPVCIISMMVSTPLWHGWSNIVKQHGQTAKHCFQTCQLSQEDGTWCLILEYVGRGEPGIKGHHKRGLQLFKPAS